MLVKVKKTEQTNENKNKNSTLKLHFFKMHGKKEKGTQFENETQI